MLRDCWIVADTDGWMTEIHLDEEPEPDSGEEVLPGMVWVDPRQILTVAGPHAALN